MTTTVAVLVLVLAGLLAVVITLGIAAWREVRLAQANRVTSLFGSGPRAVESDPEDRAGSEDR